MDARQPPEPDHRLIGNTNALRRAHVPAGSGGRAARGRRGPRQSCRFPLTAISPTCSPAPARYRARLLAASPDHLVRRMILVAHISLWLFDPPAHGCSRTTTCIPASEAVHIRCSATSLARSVEQRRLPGLGGVPADYEGRPAPGCARALTAVVTARLVPDPGINNGFPAECRRDVCFARAGRERLLQARDPAMPLMRAMVTSSPLRPRAGAARSPGAGGPGKPASARRWRFAWRLSERRINKQRNRSR